MSNSAETLTPMMCYTKECKIEEIESLLLENGAKKLNKVGLADVVGSRRAIKGRLVATLLHVKKSKEKEVSYKDPRSKKPLTTNYYRFMILTDDQQSTFGIIIQNNACPHLVFAHYEKISIGSKVVLHRPKFQGHYGSLALISTDCIYPIAGDLPKLKNFPPGSTVSDDNYCSYRITTSRFKVDSIKSCATACDGSCDGHYLDKCYCSKRIRTSCWLLGLEFYFVDHKDVDIKCYYSRNLTSKLVHESVIKSKGFSASGVMLLTEIEDHIANQLEGKELTFLIWFKPSMKEGEDLPQVVNGHISKIEFPPNCKITAFKDVLEASDGNLELISQNQATATAALLEANNDLAVASARAEAATAELETANARAASAQLAAQNETQGQTESGRLATEQELEDAGLNVAGVSEVGDANDADKVKPTRAAQTNAPLPLKKKNKKK